MNPDSHWISIVPHNHPSGPYLAETQDANPFKLEQRHLFLWYIVLLLEEVSSDLGLLQQLEISIWQLSSAYFIAKTTDPATIGNEKAVLFASRTS
jgi:hypothetical protein